MLEIVGFVKTNFINKKPPKQEGRLTIKLELIIFLFFAVGVVEFIE
jgi:hypothetical protein